MKRLLPLLIKVRDVYDIYIFLIVLFAGAFLLFVDAPKMRDKKHMKEAKIATFLGYFYVIAGTASYLLLNILL